MLVDSSFIKSGDIESIAATVNASKSLSFPSISFVSKANSIAFEERIAASDPVASVTAEVLSVILPFRNLTIELSVCAKKGVTKDSNNITDIIFYIKYYPIKKLFVYNIKIHNN